MNIITIQLCAEDRERLDRLRDVLENRITQAAPAIQTEAVTAESELVAPVKEDKPEVTLEQIHQKVVQIAAGFGGTKKVAVRELINAYAKKVSDLPEDKWQEVWDKLTALESEG